MQLFFPITNHWDLSDPSNCSPITLKGSLNDRLYRFSSRPSAGNLLAVISHSWLGALNDHGGIQLVSFDISKALGWIWYKDLLSKLSSSCIRFSRRGCHIFSVGGPYLSWSMGFCLSRFIWMLAFPKVPYLRPSFFHFLVILYQPPILFTGFFRCCHFP